MGGGGGGGGAGASSITFLADRGNKEQQQEMRGNRNLRVHGLLTHYTANDLLHMGFWGEDMLATATTHAWTPHAMPAARRAIDEPWDRECLQ